MTREEAIEYWEKLRRTFSKQLESEQNHFGRMHIWTTIDAIDTAISALQKQGLAQNSHGIASNHQVKKPFSRNSLSDSLEERASKNQVKSSWISINDRLPEQEECVLLHCKTQYGTSYKCIGFYESGTMRRDDSDYCWDYEVCDVYDEENDDYLVNKGWFERVFNWDDYSACGIEDTVTHWMPLPEKPDGGRNEVY